MRIINDLYSMSFLLEIVIKDEQVTLHGPVLLGNLLSKLTETVSEKKMYECYTKLNPTLQFSPLPIDW